MLRVALPDCPFLEQVTVTGHEPRVVEPPMSQVQEVAPEESAVFGPRPAALDGPDLYCTTIEQLAPARVCTAAVAFELRGAGEVNVVKATVIAGGGVGAGVLTGAGVGAGVLTGAGVFVGEAAIVSEAVGSGEGVGASVGAAGVAWAGVAVPGVPAAGTTVPTG